MTPAVFWILVGTIALFIGTLIIYWGTRRHDGKEPDSVSTWKTSAPSQLELAVMDFHEMGFREWQRKTPAEQWDYTNRYFTHRGL